MKRNIKVLLTVLALIIPIKAYAIDVSVSCSAPGTVTVGETFNVTISGSASISTYWNGNTINSSSNLRSNSGTGNFVEQSSSSSISKTYSFTALSEGIATVSQTMTVNDEDYNDKSFTSNTCTINIVAASSSNTSNNYSGGGSSSNYVERASNTNLSSISIEGVTLTPEFNKDTLEYKAVVSGEIEKIDLQANPEDDKAWIEGLGEKELIEGVNKFEIKVHAENDDEKVYVVEITRKEKNPIEVIINKKKYTVFKKESNVKIPKGFIKTNVVIDKQDVVAYSNKYIDYILVLLVDEKGNSNWYIYNSDNSTYTKYNEVTLGNTRLVIIKPNNKEIPIGYKKTNIKINKVNVIAYYLKGNSNFKLVYAINMNNGEEDFYQYDSKEKTFQRYNSKLVSSVEEFSKKLEVGLVAAGAALLILIIIIITQASSKSKMKKILKNKRESDAIEKIAKQEENKESSKKEENKQEEKELSKKELKKLKKEEAKKLKKEQEDFLK